MVSLTSTVSGVDDVVSIIHFSFNFIRDWQLSNVRRARDRYYYFVTHSKSTTTLWSKCPCMLFREEVSQ